MKTRLTLLSFVMVASMTLSAQRPDASAACKQAMTQLAYFGGDWKGTAALTSQAGTQQLTQQEHIVWQLDGTVLVIEGTGRNAAGEIAFKAFALVNYDPIDKQYKFRSYVKEGYSTDAYFTVLAPNSFEWGFGVPNGTGKVRYRIELDDKAKTWHETGEYSADSQTWRKFIELNLTKQ